MKLLVFIQFIHGGQGLYMNLGEWELVFRVNVNHWLEFKVLGMPHLHGEAFQESQVLAGWVLIRKEEVELVHLPRTI